VLFAGYQRTTTIIRNSIFTNNTSLQGGVFTVESESVIRVYGSTFTSNFAVISGIIQASNNGYFEFYNSTIYNNYAVSSSVSQIFDAASTSQVQNCSIYSNEVVSSTDLNIEISRT